jgi:hypothetical protein
VAAEAITKVHEGGGNFDETSLSLYGKLLEESFVMRELRAFRNAYKALDEPRLYNDYAKFINAFLKRYFDVDGTPRKLFSTFKETKGNVTMLDMMRDMVRMVTNL